jgi:ABC-type transport system involved in multi-copper enzyme maturation permease subunit
MNALVKKGFRLLLPSCISVLLLEALLPWVYTDADAVFHMTPMAFFLGLVIVAVDAFGREFSLGTFQSLMAQPIERKKVWQTKITLLLLAARVISLAYFVSCGIRVETAIHAEDSPWKLNQHIIRSDFHHAMLASGALLLVAVAGGLWTSLLLRQPTAAFWVTFLSPAMVLLALAVVIPQKAGRSPVGTYRFCFALYSRVALQRGRLLAGAAAVWPGAGRGLDRRGHSIFALALF